jgi:hypothetical protein
MKVYSNDPQDWTLEDAYSQEFDDFDWQDLVPDMIKYFHNSDYALDSFKEWWVEQSIKHHPYKEFD